MNEPNVRAWDGRSWRSNAAVIAAFLLNGIIAWPAALTLFLCFVFFDFAPIAIAASLVLFVSGLSTMAFVSYRQKSRADSVLRLIALVLNGVMVVAGGLFWARHPTVIGAGLAALCAANIACIAMIRKYYSGTLCANCGYELAHLRGTRCPECGWQQGFFLP